MGQTDTSIQRETQQSVESANSVGLRDVSDSMPGIRRAKSGRSFVYTFPIGDVIGEESTLRRIKSLAIPPAWRNVWICPDPYGHLQATGWDARRRKQYSYHPRWREVREQTKYNRMIAFGKALPKIRRRVQRDLGRRALSRCKVLATVVRLLEVSLIRVGNEEYMRQNHSFGLTTMKARHVDVNGAEMHFEFRGKGGKYHQIDIRDRRLARVVKKCQNLPGQELFQYVDEHGARQNVKSTDVNDYLHEISGQDFTAKDFRTWAGTVLAAMALQELERFDSNAQAKRNLRDAIESVAKRLGNTPTICRKCYVHPEVIHSYMDGTLPRTLQRRARTRLTRALHQLPPEEAAVLALLAHRLRLETPPGR